MGILALVIASTAALFAGFFLTSMEDVLTAMPGMMVLIYCATSMRGSIFGAMGSRIGTSMHIGTFRLSMKKGTVLRSNVEAAFALTMGLSLLMGAVGWAVVRAMFGDAIGLGRFIFISMAGGLLAGMIVLGFNLFIAYLGFKRGWDVDNITSPLIAAAGDIATVPMIYASTLLADAIGGTAVWCACGVMVAATAAMAARILSRRPGRRGRRGDEARRIVVQSFPVIAMCVMLEIAAGILIETRTEQLVEYSALLVLLPAFLNGGNALSGMLTSRLSSMLHLGTLQAGRLPPAGAMENFAVIGLLALATFAYIGAAAYAFHPDSIGFPLIMAIALAAGAAATAAIDALSYYLAVLAIRFDLDPDDHCIPVTSSTMDMLGTVVLMSAVALFI